MKTFNFGSSKGFLLENKKIQAKVISYGARLVTLCYEGKDVILGFDTLEDYKESGIYCGAALGRFANRIGNARFSLNGKEYMLDVNEHGRQTLHGGSLGFDRYEWTPEILSENSVSFTRLSPDGEMGFPGNLKITVTYTLLEDAISIIYDAVSDADTYFNPSNHAYFNLDGWDGEDCLKMKLCFHAPYYLPVDSYLIPTGEIASVEGTEFDFRTLRAIGQDYDHCFVVAMDRKEREIATLISEHSGIKMDIISDLPSIQFYTCARCNEKAGNGGIPLHLHHAVALETQFFPDSPNHENFPSTLLRAGEKFRSETRYRFGHV